MSTPPPSTSTVAADSAHASEPSSAHDELPVVFPHHVFCCFQQRPAAHPRGSCAKAGSAPLWEELTKQIQGRQLASVSMAATGCLGFCDAGPLMVVYPQGVWYQPKTTDDITEIVQTHFVEGRIVERLAVILKRTTPAEASGRS